MKGFLFPTPPSEFLNYAEYPKRFSQGECDSIIAIGKSLPLKPATVARDRHVDEEARKSNVRWLEYKEEYKWIWNKLTDLAQVSNKNFFHFELAGCLEDIQFTEYDSNDSHYDWHTDYGPGGALKRRLSLVTQLSSPDSYEGGNLQLFYDRQPVTVQPGRGNVVVFPSYTLHKVTPVTQGVRYSLVLWVSGLTSYK